MKISTLPIILIGVSIMLIAVAFGYFHNYAPRSVEISQRETELAQLQAENSKAGAVTRRVEAAKNEVRMKGEQWAQVVATKTPPTQVEAGGINLAVHAYQLTVDSKRFRDSIQAAVNRQLKRGGVQSATGLEVPVPEDNAESILSTFYNYPGIAFPVVIFDLGSTTVTGTYSQIMANVRSWSTMPNYLAVTDGLSITGTSPRLTGTYSVTLVGFIRGRTIGPPAVSVASAGAPGTAPGPGPGTPRGPGTGAADER